MGLTLFVSPEELQVGVELPAGAHHRLVVRPKVVTMRLSGLLFETNKCFLLPASLPHLKKNLATLYTKRATNELLVVGHTDTSGEPEYNDRLSLERARAVKAYLEDDVDAWLAQYQSSVTVQKRWGDPEDRLMLASVPPGQTDEVDPVKDFQSSRELEVDGIIGPVTRRRLVEEYMQVDTVVKPSSMKTTVHGCGEHFPLDDTGKELEQGAADAERDSLDRRVELFLFDGPITPAPPGENSKAGSSQYPEWRRQARVVFEHTLGPLPVLRVKFEFDGKPAANENYELRIDGRLLALTTTDDKGMIDQVIPDGASLAEVHFPKRALTRSLALVSPEEFPSAHEAKGVQLRLSQLGFFPGPATGEMNETTQLALRRFKVSHGLPDTADVDAQTESQLTLVYGS